ncbi:hypothetical protein [[Mycobacterium] burgundiense]|uniref:Fis family transcriptional regulator n=1 Tax=[Mycobacterium] burgundiense TaxID=3064286 RepID=A0ABM9LBW5_9MYCO|nr:hypothetical protein [Mycolicibacterium sp. MU0053]CAJ1496435.1 hypothetical protein MU0053_000648 [Mycolicibacterium sp. MU0053]
MSDADTWLAEREVELSATASKRFAKVWRELAERDGRAREAGLTAAAKYLAGATKPADIGKTLAKARQRAEAQLAAARVVAVLAVEDGAGEAPTAREIGVDRMALRNWLGKR